MTDAAFPMQPDGLRHFPAPAKLNLMLHVVGRRPDGYHLLETVFRFIDHADSVGLAVRADGRHLDLVEVYYPSEAQETRYADAVKAMLAGGAS